MKKIVFLAFVFICIFVFVLSTMLRTQFIASAAASTTHDLYPGQSIQEAINSVKPGDTIFVHAGTYYENVVVNKTVSLIGENRSTTIIDGNRTGMVILVTADSVVIKEFTIKNGNNAGIYFDHSDDSWVMENNVIHNVDAIFVHLSNDCTIYRNLVGNNTQRGIFITNSGDFTVSNNYVYGNGWYGINANASVNGLILQNRVYENDFDGIGLLNSNNCGVVGNNVNDNKFFGIWVDSSDNNLIYHNNLINNGFQATTTLSTNHWDNGVEGNYWSNYTGVDLYSGPYQNETGSDGIGDTSHDIDVDNQDGFPLMGPISFFNASTWNGVTWEPVYTISNSTVSDFYFSESDMFIGFKVTELEDTVGFCRIGISIELLRCANPEEWEVWVNNTLIEDRKVIPDIYYTYIYFAYNHSTQTVRIVGTSVIRIPPNADAGPDQSVFKGMTVTFDGSNSTDNVGIASYTWSFVDVTQKTLTDEKPKYTFNNVGDFEVTLNVSDYAGYWDVDTTWIHVLPDTTKPSIGIVSREPDRPQVSWYDLVTITVDVTDDESGVSNVTFSYSTDGGETWTNVTMQKTTGDTYQGRILMPPIYANVQYKITAYDNAENFAVDDNAGEYYVFTVIPEFPTWISMLLILILLTVATVIHKRRLLKTPIH